jgi:phage-related protein
MTTTFTWPINGDPTGTIKYNLLESKFGDGYAQRIPNGINNKMQMWPVSIECDDITRAAIISFLDALNGASAFFWTPPGGVQGYYVCKSFSVVPHTSGASGFTTINALFEQTFAP